MVRYSFVIGGIVAVLLSIWLLETNAEAVSECGTIYDDWATPTNVEFNQSTARMSTLNEEITIPVVFHVLHYGDQDNISDYQIHSQLKVLNEDFSGANLDLKNAPNDFKQVIARDSKLRFKLAELDPVGRTTTGINRVKVSYTQFDKSSNRMKYASAGGVDAWNPQYYLNIWVCNLGGSPLGYAQFPKHGDPKADGVVLDFRVVGKKSKLNKPPYDLGRTATHEVGHWLGLKHIWGDDRTGCDSDDGIADTPVAASKGVGCEFVKECGSLNMNNNFMDYGDDACINAFTKGQVNKMQSLFYSGGARELIKVSPAFKNKTNTPIAKGDQTSTSNNPIYNANLVVKKQVGSWLVGWKKIPFVDFYSLKVKIGEGSSWKYYDIPKEATSASLSNLNACTVYDLQVIGVKGVKSLVGRSDVVRVNTQMCDSKIPKNFKQKGRKKRLTTFTWTPTQAGVYEVQWRVFGSIKVNKDIVKESTITIHKKKQDQIYQVRVRSVLNDGSFSDFSEVLAF